MLSALNFCAKAAADLRSHPFPHAPLAKAGSRWVANLLEQAQVFVLPDGGCLLDRTKPKPEVPGLVFRPPFPVTALEYVSTDTTNDDPVYHSVPCPKRIALAWDWNGDVPAPPLVSRDDLAPGVGIIGVFYVQGVGKWMCNSVAVHLPYDGRWCEAADMRRFPFQAKIVARNPTIAGARGYSTSIMPVLPEQLMVSAGAAGSRQAALDIAMSDNNDEFVAYVDLCYALACKNVVPKRMPGSKIVNGKRRRPDLRDFHVLHVGGDAEGVGLGSASHHAARSHLRRGHIRRLAPDRITWVNQTMVRGRGFVRKAYAMAGSAA